MDVKVLTNKTVTSELITNSDYFSGNSLLFSRNIAKSSLGGKYSSYSSLVDNMMYQPTWVKNPYELGDSSSESEIVSILSNSYLFDKIPKGVDKVVYKSSGENLIEVSFLSKKNGIVEYNYDQVLLISFEKDDDTVDLVEPSVRIHGGTENYDGLGHRFHRAYNAIQYQNSNSIASKLLITAIFDTYDIDFCKGTLIGGDTSKYFIGNRIVSESSPVIYSKFANYIIDTDSDKYNYLKDYTIDQIELEKELFADRNNNDIIEFIGIQDPGFYKLRIEEIDGGVKSFSLNKMKSEEIPNINPVFSNESTTSIDYIGTMTSSEINDLGYIYYPASKGSLFEYPENTKEGNSSYYYLPSIFLDSGFKNAQHSDPENNYNLPDYISSSSEKLREESKTYSPVVGVRLTEDDETLSFISISNLSAALGGLLDEDSSKWRYTKSGELIIDNNQLNKTYPII